MLGECGLTKLPSITGPVGVMICLQTTWMRDREPTVPMKAHAMTSRLPSGEGACSLRPSQRLTTTGRRLATTRDGKMKGLMC